MNIISMLTQLLFTTFLVTYGTSCAISKAHQKNPKQVGEVAPCSSRVALKITELIKRDHSPKKIIEVGAGSGALTDKIIGKMNENDHLDLIEIEPILCEVLQEKYGHLKNVAIHCMDFLAWQPDYQYDYVVSTLPFNSFPPELVQKLVDHLVEVSKDGANLGFVEYKWLSTIRMTTMSIAEREQFKQTRKIISDFYNKYRLYETDVYINFPPIIIYHLKIVKP